MWAAAVMAMEDSTMQPSMTFMPWARATWIIRRASPRPPHFISLILMPSKASARRGISSARPTLSSAIRGSGLCLLQLAHLGVLIRRQRLFHELHSHLLQPLEPPEGIVEGPPLVGVDPEPAGRSHGEPSRGRGVVIRSPS